jgi:type I restriction enzyme, S subunit
MRTVPLGELGQIVSGATPKTSVASFWDGDIPWVTPADLSTHRGVYFHRIPRRITEAGFASCSATMLPAGSILFSSRAPIGHCAVTAYPLCTNQGFKSVIPNSRLHPIYGFFALRYLTPSIIAKGRGATFVELSKELMEEIQVPYRDFPDQERVAGVLARTDRLCDARRYALDASDDLLTAVFRDVFGERIATGAVRPLGEAVRITGGGTPSRAQPQYFTGSIPWLTSKDMRGDYIWDTEEHVTEEAIASSATKLVPADSILVVVKSKVLMHRLPVAIAKSAMCHGQDIKSLQCREGFHHEFVRFILRHHEGRLLNLARGANTEGLTLPMLEELPVPDVDYGEQAQFAKLVEREERLRGAQREALRLTEHLFRSLLDQAFTELD